LHPEYTELEEREFDEHVRELPEEAGVRVDVHVREARGASISKGRASGGMDGGGDEGLGGLIIVDVMRASWERLM